jgi:hypothetical protein
MSGSDFSKGIHRIFYYFRKLLSDCPKAFSRIAEALPGNTMQSMNEADTVFHIQVKSGCMMCRERVVFVDDKKR